MLNFSFKVTSLMNPEPIWVWQNQAHELLFYFLVSFTVPHQDEPSCEVKSSLSKVKVYTQKLNKNDKLLRLLQKCLLESNPVILGRLI